MNHLVSHERRQPGFSAAARASCRSRRQRRDVQYGLISPEPARAAFAARRGRDFVSNKQYPLEMSAWRTGLLRSTMRYGFLMRAPNRTTGDLRWVVTETNKNHAVVTSIDVLRKVVLPGAAVVGAGATYIYVQNSKMKASRETPMGFGFEKEAVGEVPAMTEESSPAVRGSR